WPCAVGIVRRLIPLESRGLANGIFHSGASIGAVLTPLVVLLLVGDQGENWRLVFQLIGGAGLLWSVLWFSSLSRAHTEAFARLPAAAEEEGSAEPIGHMFTLRTFWITLTV